MVKIVGLNIDLGTRETFYLDRDCIVLKPREDEPAAAAARDHRPDQRASWSRACKLEQPSLTQRAAKFSTRSTTAELHTSIDIRTIDLSQPLSITMVTTQRHDHHLPPRLHRPAIAAAASKSSNYADNQQRTIHTVDLTPDSNVPITFYE